MRLDGMKLTFISTFHMEVMLYHHNVYQFAKVYKKIHMTVRNG